MDADKELVLEHLRQSEGVFGLTACEITLALDGENPLGLVDVLAALDWLLRNHFVAENVGHDPRRYWLSKKGAKTKEKVRVGNGDMP